MKKKTLIVGGDSKMSRYLVKRFKEKKIDYLLTTRRKKKMNNKNIFLNLLDLKKINIPNDINSAIILAGIDGENNSKREYKNAKNISGIAIPYLIKELIKKNIFVIYLSTMSIYNKNSLYGNLRLLAEKKILNKKGKKYNKKISIIRPSKNVILNNSLIKWLLEMRKRNYSNYFQPILFSDTVNFILKIVQQEKEGIFNVIGKKIFYYKSFKNNNLNQNQKTKIEYKNNFKINKPTLTKIIGNKKIKNFILKNLNERN